MTNDDRDRATARMNVPLSDAYTSVWKASDSETWNMVIRASYNNIRLDVDSDPVFVAINERTYNYY
jgi:hypothetical protein